MSVRSLNGNTNCIIDIDDSSKDVITASSGETNSTEIIGFTIKGGGITTIEDNAGNSLISLQNAVVIT
ncbi:MAG TPA: hypothetical protein EYQ40_06275, partial [Candidatus Marinimicrobia bacterium]|nr:hypothetical protein [Candidatus Neomarinimicrobiota bacterium]